MIYRFEHIFYYIFKNSNYNISFIRRLISEKKNNSVQQPPTITFTFIPQFSVSAGIKTPRRRTPQQQQQKKSNEDNPAGETSSFAKLGSFHALKSQFSLSVPIILRASRALAAKGERKRPTCNSPTQPRPSAAAAINERERELQTRTPEANFFSSAFTCEYVGTYTLARTQRRERERRRGRANDEIEKKEAAIYKRERERANGTILIQRSASVGR